MGMSKDTTQYVNLHTNGAQKYNLGKDYSYIMLILLKVNIVMVNLIILNHML